MAYTAVQKRKMEQRLKAVYNECIEEMNVLDVPFGKITEVTVNYRAKSRWGQCKKTGDIYTINISSILLEDATPDKGLKETIIHEIIHTCPKCMCHTGEWKRWVDLVNDCYGYAIKRTNSAADKGVDEDAYLERRTAGVKIKYRFRCDKCGAEINRARESRFTRHYEMYRCAKCHGRISRVA